MTSSGKLATPATARTEIRQIIGCANNDQPVAEQIDHGIVQIGEQRGVVRRNEHLPGAAIGRAFQNMRDHRPPGDRHKAFVANPICPGERIDGTGAAAGKDQDRTAHAALRRAAAGAIWRSMLSATIVSISVAWVKPAATAERENSFSDHRLQLRLTSSSRTSPVA